MLAVPGDAGGRVVEAEAVGDVVVAMGLHVVFDDGGDELGVVGLVVEVAGAVEDGVILDIVIRPARRCAVDPRVGEWVALVDIGVPERLWG